MCTHDVQFHGRQRKESASPWFYFVPSTRESGCFHAFSRIYTESLLNLFSHLARKLNSIKTKNSTLPAAIERLVQAKAVRKLGAFFFYLFPSDPVLFLQCHRAADRICLIHLASLLIICSPTLCSISSFVTLPILLIFSILFRQHISKLSSSRRFVTFNSPIRKWLSVFYLIV